MKLYAESSAVLSWLLGEPSAVPVREELAAAELVLASELTLIECDRVLIRAVATQQMTEADAADRRAHLRHATEHWTVLALDEETVERARRPFPVEPIRTLDAIHLATAVVARGMVPGTKLLSLDERIRRNGAAMGLEVLPA